MKLSRKTGARWRFLRAGSRTMVRNLAWCALTAMLAGCAVPAHQHRLVSKPNMLFSDSNVYGYTSRLMNQIQPGLAASGGAQASTCTVCQ